MKPTQSHLNTAQRIYDRLGRGSVADIDAIAQALAEAERGGLNVALEINAGVANEGGGNGMPALAVASLMIAHRIAGDAMIRKEAES